MDEEYRKIKKVNQSSLKKILTSPQAYIKARDRIEPDITPEHFVFGRLVDDMLLSPKTIMDKYYVMREDNVSDTVKSIVRYVYDYVKSEEILPFIDIKLNTVILDACKTYDYQPRWKDDTKISKIQVLGEAYFNILSVTKGMTIIQEDEYNKAVICVTAMKNDRYIKKYFVKSDTIESIDRFIVQFKIGELECKGELDKVHIDHGEKTIQPIDFKYTGKSVLGFNYDFWKYRYDFQGAFYTIGLLKNSKIRALLLDGYELLPFQYIVVEKDMNNLPMIFQFTDEVLNIGKFGGTLENGRKLMGVKQAIEKYNYHTVVSNWDYPMEYEESNGIVELKM